MWTGLPSPSHSVTSTVVRIPEYRSVRILTPTSTPVFQPFFTSLANTSFSTSTVPKSPTSTRPSPPISIVRGSTPRSVSPANTNYITLPASYSVNFVPSSARTPFHDVAPPQWYYFSPTIHLWMPLPPNYNLEMENHYGTSAPQCSCLLEGMTCVVNLSQMLAHVPGAPAPIAVKRKLDSAMPEEGYTWAVWNQHRKEWDQYPTEISKHLESQYNSKTNVTISMGNVQYVVDIQQMNQVDLNGNTRKVIRRLCVPSWEVFHPVRAKWEPFSAQVSKDLHSCALQGSSQAIVKSPDMPTSMGILYFNEERLGTSDGFLYAIRCRLVEPQPQTVLKTPSQLQRNIATSTSWEALTEDEIKYLMEEIEEYDDDIKDILREMRVTPAELLELKNILKELCLSPEDLLDASNVPLKDIQNYKSGKSKAVDSSDSGSEEIDNIVGRSFDSDPRTVQSNRAKGARPQRIFDEGNGNRESSIGQLTREVDDLTSIDPASSSSMVLDSAGVPLRSKNSKARRGIGDSNNSQDTPLQGMVMEVEEEKKRGPLGAKLPKGNRSFNDNSKEDERIEQLLGNQEGSFADKSSSMVRMMLASKAPKQRRAGDNSSFGEEARIPHLEQPSAEPNILARVLAAKQARNRRAFDDTITRGESRLDPFARENFVNETEDGRATNNATRNPDYEITVDPGSLRVDVPIIPEPITIKTNESNNNAVTQEISQEESLGPGAVSPASVMGDLPHSPSASSSQSLPSPPSGYQQRPGGQPNISPHSVSAPSPHKPNTNISSPLGSPSSATQAVPPYSMISGMPKDAAPGLAPGQPRYITTIRKTRTIRDDREKPQDRQIEILKKLVSQVSNEEYQKEKEKLTNKLNQTESQLNRLMGQQDYKTAELQRLRKMEEEWSQQGAQMQATFMAEQSKVLQYLQEMQQQLIQQQQQIAILSQRSISPPASEYHSPSNSPSSRAKQLIINTNNTNYGSDNSSFNNNPYKRDNSIKMSSPSIVRSHSSSKSGINMSHSFTSSEASNAGVGDAPNSARKESVKLASGDSKSRITFSGRKESVRSESSRSGVNVVAPRRESHAATVPNIRAALEVPKQGAESVGSGSSRTPPTSARVITPRGKSPAASSRQPPTTIRRRPM